MGIETRQVYTCDVGGEESEDPTGWVLFTLSTTALTPLTSVALAPGSDLDAAAPADPPFPFGATTTLACPAHVPGVKSIIDAGLNALRESRPSPKTPPTRTPATKD